MANVGDRVIYKPGTTGRPTAEATVTKVNEDGSVNIEYPHPAAPDVMASAEQCQWGTSIYQVEMLPEDVVSARAKLEDMTRAELDAYALTLGIDTSDARNKGEAIQRIETVPATPASSGTAVIDPEAHAALLTAHTALQEQADELQTKLDAALAELATLTGKADDAEEAKAQTEADAANHGGTVEGQN